MAWALLGGILAGVLGVQVAYHLSFAYPPHSSHDGYLLVPQLARLFRGYVPEHRVFGMFSPTWFHGPLQGLSALDAGAWLEAFTRGRFATLFGNRILQPWVETPHALAAAAVASLLLPGVLLAPYLAMQGYLGVMLVSIYAIAARLGGRTTGLVAAAVAGGTPGVFGFARYLEGHLPVAALTSACVALLLYSEGFRRPVAVGVLGLVGWSALRTGESTAEALGAGLELWGPFWITVAVAVATVRRRPPRSRPEGGSALAPLALVPGLLLAWPTLGWLLASRRNVTDGFLDPPVQLDVVEQMGEAWASVIWPAGYGILYAVDYLCPPFFLALPVGTGLAVCALWRGDFRRPVDALAVAAWWLVPLAAYSWMQRKASWYGVGLVPPAVVVLAVGLRSVRNNGLRRLVTGLLLGLSGLQLLAFTFVPADDFPPWLRQAWREPLPRHAWRMRRVDLARPVDEPEMRLTEDHARILLRHEFASAGGRPVYVALLTLGYRHDYAVRFLLETGGPDLEVVNLLDTRVRRDRYRGLHPAAFRYLVYAPDGFADWPPSEADRAWLSRNIQCREADPVSPFLGTLMQQPWRRETVPAGEGRPPVVFYRNPEPAPPAERGEIWAPLRGRPMRWVRQARQDLLLPPGQRICAP